MSAQEFYNRALRNGVELECNCTNISPEKWDELMEGAVRADKKKLLKAVGIREEFENLDDFWRTKTHLI